MTPYKKSFLIFSVAILIYLSILSLIAIKLPFWGDEVHFVNTIHQFGKGINLDLLKHYSEMSAPLPFIFYSIWGRIINFNIETLRLFSLIISFITLLLFHNLVFYLFRDIKTTLLATAFLAVNPYMIGLSIFVFTDMLTILFLILSCVLLIKKKPFLLSISLAAGTLCRQYVIFFILSLLVYYLIEYLNNYRNGDSKSLKMLLFCLASTLPITLLAFYWNGLSPENELKQIYLDDAFIYHLSFLTLYICQFFVYLFPLVLIYWDKFYINKFTITVSVILSFLYWLFPVRACNSQIANNIFTVGFFHKLIRHIFNNPFIEDLIFYSAFLLGLPIVIFILRDVYIKLRYKNFDFSLLLDWSILMFLFVMPFSYLVWEKYFLLILPIATVRILLIKYSNSNVLAI
jgi:4-amino-4-deoxy-L-arabinose transferase-like glycosyltransferase